MVSTSLIQPQCRRMFVWWFCAAVVSWFACGAPSSQPPPGNTAPQAAKAAPDPSETAAPDPSTTAAPDQAATACTSDGECNFADPCQPVRCVASPARDACGHPAALEGRCICFERKCTLHPSGPRVSQGSCNNTGDCALDVTTARCEPGVAPDAEFRVRYSGPMCRCDPNDRRCHLQWFDPVSCQSSDDCWVAEEPVPHAIPRPPKLKGRAFRGCVDGERVPACVDGHCTLNALTC